MLCAYCKHELPEGAKVCADCGAQRFKGDRWRSRLDLEHYHQRWAIAEGIFLGWLTIVVFNVLVVGGGFLQLYALGKAS